MSHHVALTRIKAKVRKAPIGWNWWAICDKTGKVRDWVPAPSVQMLREIVKKYRPGTPKDFTFHLRGPVTKENW